MGTSQSTKEQRLRDAEKDVLTFGASWFASSHRRAVKCRLNIPRTKNNRTLHTVKCVRASAASDVEFKSQKEVNSKESHWYFYMDTVVVLETFTVLPNLAKMELLRSKIHTRKYALEYNENLTRASTRTQVPFTHGLLRMWNQFQTFLQHDR